MLLLFFGISFSVIVLVILLNPNFWQGYRNSNYIDEFLMSDIELKDSDDLSLSK